MFKENEDGLPVVIEAGLGENCQSAPPYLPSSSSLATAKSLIEELEKFYSFRANSVNTLVHELRSPISSIEMAISMLEIRLKQKGLLHNPEHHLPQYLNMLRRECDRSIKLANDLQTGWLKVLQGDSEGMADWLTMREDQVPPLETHQIDNLYDELTFIVEPFWLITRQRRQVLRLALPTNLPSITTNRSGLTHILTELLTNACRYTPAGETITFSASLQPEGVSLCVGSTGVEIPSNHLPFLFQPPHLVPRHLRWQTEVSDLGLSLIKQLANQMGATIQADSFDEQIQFTVCLPVEGDADFGF